MVNVGLSTSAAPTYFEALLNGGYVMVDGDLWANNPVMNAVVDALACYDIEHRQIQVLSLGCGETAFKVDEKLARGGLINWRKVIKAAMRTQSLNALGQTYLLVGKDQVMRLDAPDPTPIGLDDFERPAMSCPSWPDRWSKGPVARSKGCFSGRPLNRMSRRHLLIPAGLRLVVPRPRVTDDRRSWLWEASGCRKTREVKMSTVKNISRRQIVMAVAVPIAMSDQAAQGASQPSDSGLIETSRKFDKAAARVDAITRDPSLADILYALDKLSGAEADILAKHAQTIDGLRVKARAACWALLGDLDVIGETTK